MGGSRDIMMKPVKIALCVLAQAAAPELRATGVGRPWNMSVRARRLRLRRAGGPQINLSPLSAATPRPRRTGANAPQECRNFARKDQREHLSTGKRRPTRPANAI